MNLETLERRVDRLERVVGLGKLQISMAPSELTLGENSTATDAKAQLMALRDFLYGLSDSEHIGWRAKELIRQEIKKIVV